jgi:hypothetical protein
MSAIAIAQNPLKTALVGNNQSVYYSASKNKFSNYKGEKIFLNDILDNRSLNWNKKINDTVKIELIRDFWKYPFKYLVTEKLKRDLNDQKIELTSNKSLSDYIITATIESSYPKYTKVPERYFVYTRVNFNVLKNGVIKLEKGYEDYYNFNAESDEWHTDLNNNMLEGANYAMWIGMRRAFDKFYADFDNVLVDLPVAPTEVPLAVNAVTSNIANDEAIMKNQTPYMESSKKEEKPKSIKNASEKAAKQSINESIETAEAKKPFESVAPKNAPSMAEKIVEQPKSNKDLIAEYQKANKATQEQARAKSLDSILQVKQKEAAMAKAKKEQEEIASKNKANAEKIRIDSLKATELASLESSVKQQKRQDSIKKAEINKQLELAKAKKEEAKKRLLSEEQTKKEFLAKLELEKQAKKDSLAKVETQKTEARKIQLAKAEQEKQTKSIVSANTVEKKREPIKMETVKPEQEKQAKILDAQLAKAKKAELAKIEQEKQATIKIELAKLEQEKQARKDAIASAEKQKREAQHKMEELIKAEKELAEAKRKEFAKIEAEKKQAAKLAQSKLEEANPIQNNIETAKKDETSPTIVKKDQKKSRIVSRDLTEPSENEKVLTSNQVKAIKDSLTDRALKIAKATKKSSVNTPTDSKIVRSNNVIETVRPSVSAYKSMEDYRYDSIQYEKQIEEKKSAILALMNQVKSADQNNVDLLTGNRTAFDPMYDSGDPTSPKSKVPDMRTREEKERDRIFTPQNEQSEKLLGQVLMITPTEEIKIESLYNTTDIAERNRLIDSFFIAKQMNRSKFNETIDNQIKTANPKKEVKEDSKTKEDSKKDVIKKDAKSVLNTIKETKSTSSAPNIKTEVAPTKKEDPQDIKKTNTPKTEKKEVPATPIKK